MSTSHLVPPLALCAALLAGCGRCGAGAGAVGAAGAALGAPGASARPPAYAEVHYDGDTAAEAGVGAPPGSSAEVMVHFRRQELAPYAGHRLHRVRVQWGSGRPAAATLKVYGAGEAEPGEVLHQQAIDPGSLTLSGWNELPLSTPLALSGEDLWVGLAVTSPGAHVAGIRLDAEPQVVGVNVIDYRGAWEGIDAEHNLKLRLLVLPP